MPTRIGASLFFGGFALLTAAAGCRESTVGEAAAITATELVGRWVSSRNDLAPAGWHQGILTFTIDGRFTFENRTYGLYEGQQRDDLSAFSRAEGRYSIDRDRLIFDPRRRVWWDHFNGAQSRERVDEPYPWDGLFDDARYSVRDDHFTLSYTIYPADAPVPANVEYTRER